MHEGAPHLSLDDPAAMALPVPAIADVGDTFITLTWPAAGAALELQCRAAGAPWASATATPVPAGATTLTLAPLAPQATYEVRLAAVDGAGGERRAGASVCVDTAPVGCGGAKKPGGACAIA